MTNFNWVDYTVLGMLFASIIAGLMRGFVKEMIALATWIAAFVVATIFATPLAASFTSSPKVQSTISSASTSLGISSSAPASLLSIGLSFVFIFVCVLIVGKVISYFISSAVEGRGISFANRFLGGVFGLARGVLFVLLMMFLVQLTPVSSQPYWQGSQFVASFQPTVKWIGEIMQPGIENLKAKVGTTVKNVSSEYIQGASNNFKVW